MTMGKESGKGFTLVELAIVMMIIGLLIGGVLKGQELLANASITSTIAQVNAYQAAFTSFQDTYSQLPGDMVNATARVPNCSASTFCFNGNGDGMIGATSGNTMQTSQAGTTSLPQVETTMFWKHLLLADLISGITPSANPGEPAWGETHPSSNLRGGFLVAHKTTSEPNFFPSGTFLMLRGGPRIVGGSTASANTPLSPREAWVLDTKIDDGHPNTGYVAGEHVANGCKTSDGAGGEYLIRDSRRVCVVAFRLD